LDDPGGRANSQMELNEGTGFTYGFHGYWTRDWSALDLQSLARKKKELAELSIQKSSVLMVFELCLMPWIDHTGPVTAEDSVLPNDWVRTSPKCTYQSYDTYINCTLVDNLPDVKTESNENVALPTFLANKWKKKVVMTKKWLPWMLFSKKRAILVLLNITL